MSDTVRPTKKQRDILTYIEQFIAEHGYSPSYREIMNGLNYTSVATVSLHVNSLIRRGHLRKRDHSARSLEVVEATVTTPASTAISDGGDQAAKEKWLATKVDRVFQSFDAAADNSEQLLAQLALLVQSLELLELPALAKTFSEQLSQLQNKEVPPAASAA